MIQDRPSTKLRSNSAAESDTFRPALGAPPHSAPLRAAQQVDAVLSIDLVHADIPLVAEIQEKAGLSRPASQDLEIALRSYCTRADVPRIGTKAR